MRRVLAYAGALALVGVVQAAWLARVRVAGAAPDPLLALAVGVGVLQGAERGAVVGTAAGLLQDLLSGGGPLGVYGLSKLVVGFGSGLFERSIYVDNPLLPAVAAAAGTVVSEVILLAVAGVVGLALGPWPVELARIAAQVILNSALAPAVFRGIRALEAWVVRAG
ncbi:MAG: rod shape-determining protein MreD [Armatimonadota bacterium]|nr:rod shape-determining protein MreD [Armatimonadota bacterium]